MGASAASEREEAAAEAVGEGIARAGAVLVCGGLGGVMEAGCRGARSAGGVTVGLLPGVQRSAGNPFLSVALPTGLGELRNGLVVRAADALIAVGGGFGTLSEIALALRIGRPVVALGSWDLGRGGAPPPGMHLAGSPAEAVALACSLAGESERRHGD